MKRFRFLIIAALSAAVVYSCTTDVETLDVTEGRGKTILKASSESVTRTTMGDNHSVVWSEDDQVQIYGMKGSSFEESYGFTLVSGAGTTEGEFEGLILNEYETYISIIIPVYNVEKYLRECLDSLLNQTFQDFEIICVDDGSTDKSLEILQEYKRKDDRFVILQQRHSGAGSARNNGIRLAEGKYIQFLDADDYFEPTLLEEMYNHAEKFDADLTVCSSRKVDDEGNITESGNPNSPINIDLTPMEKLFCWQDFIVKNAQNKRTIDDYNINLAKCSLYLKILIC